MKQFKRPTQSKRSSNRVLSFTVTNSSDVISYDGNIDEFDVMAGVNALKALELMGIPVTEALKAHDPDIDLSEDAVTLPILMLNNVTVREGRKEDLWVSPQSKYIGTKTLAEQGIENDGKPMYIPTVEFLEIGPDGETLAETAWATINAMSSVVTEIVGAMHPEYAPKIEQELEAQMDESIAKDDDIPF